MTTQRHDKSTTRRARGARLVLAGIVGAGAVIAASSADPTVSPATALSPTSIISTFYVPIFEDNAYASLFAINGATGAALSSTTSLTISATGTVVYYDQWEDGYEPDVEAPAQTTSMVLGDGNTSNGDAATYCVPARCAGDTLPAGAVLRLNNSTTVTPGSLAVPRLSSTVVFDGRDKISATAGLAVTHATWPTNTDALHAKMAAAFDTSRWGVNFVAPVGVNTPQQGDGFDHFSYSGVEVMAKQAGTVVSIDVNADGDFVDPVDVNAQTIGEGQTIYVNGGVNQGARIQSSVPVQAFLLTGRIGSNYADRTFQLFPTEGLVNDYIAPASTASATDAQASVLYVFNPQNTAITVTVTTSAGATNYSVPAGQVLDPAPFLDVNQPARLTSTSTFAALAATGTREGAQGQDFDWGYSLVPARLLSTAIDVGWAPGSQNLSNATYDPVWVTATGATTLYVDYDGDPTTGANLDPSGGRYDTAFTITGALTLTKVTDSGDNDMTGARLYTTSGVTIAAAYGEDPSTAPLGFPGIDLGTALFPSCGALCVQKSLNLVDDVDSDGQIDPGDTIRWTIRAANTGYYALTNAVLTDTLQSGLTYVPGTTVIGGSAAADDMVPPKASVFPFDETGRSLGTLGVGGSVTVTFDTTVDNPYTGPSGKIVNRAVVLSDQANGGDTEEAPLDSLRLVKTSSGVDPVTVGSTLTYTLTATNTGTSTLAPVDIHDALPAGLTWVSTSVTRPTDNSSTYADNFESTTWAGSTGSNSWTDATWVESGDSATTPVYNTGLVRNISESASRRIRFTGNGNNRALSRVAGNTTSVDRGLTLSYVYKRTSLEADDVVLAQIRPNSSAAWTTLATYTNGADTAYVAASFDVMAYRGTATEVRFISNQNLDDTGDNLYIDDVVLTAVTRGSTTVAGAAPPTVASIPSLLAGESATITIVSTVSSAPNPDIYNIATATSGNLISRSRVSNCVLCFDFGDDPASYDGANPGRARASRPTVTTATIADNFETAGSWAGSTGSLAWNASAWTETDGGGLGTAVGRVQKATDGGDTSLWFTDGAVLNEGVSRVVGDLSTYEFVLLSLQKRCNGLEADDIVNLEVRPNGTAAWQVLTQYSNCNDVAYSTQTFALASSQYGTATEIRLRVSDAFGTGTPDQLYIDQVRFELTDISYTSTGPRLGAEVDREAAAANASPGGAPVGDDLAGSPDDEDGVTLPAMSSDDYTFSFTVTDPSGGATYVNAWFDWNNNGVFDASESAFDAATFVSGTGGLVNVGGVATVPGPGTYSVTIDMPNLATNGSGFVIGNSIYSRVRVATDGSEITAAKARGLSTDGEVEDYRTTLNTLPVNISFVDSQRADGQTTYEWRTAQEVDNAGFNVYAERPDGSLRKVNRSLIASKAPTTIEPQSYSLSVNGSVRTFWIEDVALDGVKELHGPYTVGTPYGDPTPPEEISWDATQDAIAALEASQTRDAVAAARRASQQRQAELARTGRVSRTAPLADITVDTAGVQQVSYTDLVAAGVDLAGVPAASIALTDPTGPVPIEVTGGSTFGEGSVIRFVGAPLDTLYSGVNVYRLRIDPSMARRIAVDPAAVATSGRITPSTTHRATAVAERDVFYSVSTPGDDPWYERSMNATRGRTRTASASVDAAGAVLTGATRASVELWGLTKDPVVDEHHVRLSVNGVIVAEGRFDGQNGYTLGGDVPSGVLVAGANTLTLTLTNDTGAATSMIAIDRWTIEYERANSAPAGSVDLQATSRRIDVNDVPAGDVLAYRLSGRSNVSAVNVVRQGSTVSVAGRPTGFRYLVTTVDAVVHPTVVATSAPADLFGGRADYLIVTHAVLRDALQPLVEHHRSLGRTVKVVEVDDLYDTYSGGVVDAGAIDAYLARAIPALNVKWLLIAGSDSIDYRDVDGDGSVSLVPSLYGATGFGVTHAPIDAAYADVDVDGMPDVAMGRLPARTADELTAMIDKTIAADTATRARTITMASDAADGIDYASVLDGLATHFDGWDVTRADVDRGGVAEAKATLLDALAAGTTYTMYLGHSSTHQWTSLGLFDSATAASLPATTPTVLAQFGCWNTYYASPYADTLGQTLMGDPDGGAAAVMGATTLTSAGNDVALAESLSRALASGTLTIGDALLQAKRATAQSTEGSTVDIAMGWTLLGDPALSGVAGG